MSVSQSNNQKDINSELIIHYDVLEVLGGELRIETAYKILFEEIERIENEKNGQKLLSNP